MLSTYCLLFLFESFIPKGAMDLLVEVSMLPLRRIELADVYFAALIGKDSGYSLEFQPIHGWFSSKSPCAHFVQSTSCTLIARWETARFDVYLFVCVEARRSDRNAPEGERRSWRRAPARALTTSLPSLAARARDLSCLSSDIFLLHVARFANSPRALRWLCAAAAACGAEKDISTFRAPWLLRVCVFVGHGSIWNTRLLGGRVTRLSVSSSSLCASALLLLVRACVVVIVLCGNVIKLCVPSRSVFWGGV